MTDAMQVLYSYAQDYIVRSLLEEEPEYGEALRCAENREEHFRAQLDETAREDLEALLDEQNQLFFHRGQALFRAGFRLAMELGRA